MYWRALVISLFLVSPWAVFGQGIVAGPWLQAMTEISVTIMWEGAAEAPGSVEYGTGFALSVPATAVLVPPTTDGTGKDTPVLLYTAKLTGLQPGTTYPYRVRLGNTLTPSRDFTTHSHDKPRWRVAHISDTHTFRLMAATHGLNDVMRWEPDYVVVSGDIADTSTNQDYREHMQLASLLLWGHIPHYTVRGNHDSRAWSTYPYWFHNEYPGSFSEDFYRVDIGPVTYLGINANQIERLYPAGALQWLEGQLQAAQHRPWTIVFMKPNPASTWKDYAAERTQFLMPMFAKYGVDLVLAGGNSAGFHRDVDGVQYQHAGLGNNRGWWSLDLTATDMLVQWHQPDGTIGKQYTLHSPTPPEEPPAAPVELRIMATPAEGLHPLTVYFTASAMPETAGMQYAWDFGDGTQGAGAQEMHCYRQPGVYTVRLTGTAPTGQQGQAQERVVVQSNPCGCP